MPLFQERDRILIKKNACGYGQAGQDYQFHLSFSRP